MSSRVHGGRGTIDETDITSSRCLWPFAAHARGAASCGVLCRSEVIAWLDTADQPPETVYLVHGEPESANTLEAMISRRDGWQAAVARDGERTKLG